MLIRSVFVSFWALLMFCAVSGPGAAHADAINFSGLQAVMQVSADPRTDGRKVSLLADSRFGSGGIAGGFLNFTSGGFPEPVATRWFADPFGGPVPRDGSAALTFNLDGAGNVSGVTPDPFRLFISYPPDPVHRPGTGIGELDFSGVSGFLGSLHLSGVTVHAVNAAGSRTGRTHSVNPFVIQAAPIPEPATVLLFGSGLACLAGFQMFRRKSRDS